MKYLSLFSGIEAATVAWHPLGWEPVGFSEIDPFASAVLAHYYPNVPNFGNVAEADYSGLTPDLVVFGSPCQSFSIAGKRLGLDDPRGNLALIALGVVEQLRPRWFLFENVPGLLSSGGGRDFGQFLATVGECGYQCVWRVLDAQYFGVAQRRRRVFVVGYIGDWRPAAAVLFERESLSRHPAPSREEGKKVADWPADCAATLNASFGSKQGLEDQHALGGASWFVPTKDVAGPLTAGMSKGPRGTEGVESNHVVAIQAQALKEKQPDGQGFGLDESGLSYTLTAGDRHALSQGLSVRRLTPTECERLQGFPDGFTQIPYRNKPAEKCPDGPRYKALGNSFAVPVLRWIGERIQRVEDLTNGKN